jgi:hypothetical protein
VTHWQSAPPGPPAALPGCGGPKVSEWNPGLGRYVVRVQARSRRAIECNDPGALARAQSLQPRQAGGRDRHGDSDLPKLHNGALPWQARVAPGRSNLNVVTSPGRREGLAGGGSRLGLDSLRNRRPGTYRRKQDLALSSTKMNICTLFAEMACPFRRWICARR